MTIDIQTSVHLKGGGIASAQPIGYIITDALYMIVRLPKYKTEMKITPPAGWRLKTDWPGCWKPDLID